MTVPRPGTDTLPADGPASTPQALGDVRELPAVAPQREPDLTVAAFSPWAARVGWVCVAITLGIHLWVVWVMLRAGERILPIMYGVGLGSQVATAVLGVTSAVVGAVVVSRRPRNAVGWLFVLTGPLTAIGSVTWFWPAVALAQGPSGLAEALAATGSVNLQGGFILIAPLVVLLFPDGRSLGPRWRWVGVACVFAALLHGLQRLFTDPRAGPLPGVGNPFVTGGPLVSVLETVEGLGLVVGAICLALAATSAVRRYRAAGGVERLQLKWFAWGASVTVATSLPVVFLWLAGDPRETAWGELVGVLFLVGTTVCPVAAGVAILRYRLYGIDRIVNRTVLYGALTAILAGIVAGLITLTQRLFIAATGESSDLAIVFTALVATASYTPLRKRMEGSVDRRFRWESGFGEYQDQVRRVAEVSDPTTALTRLLEESFRVLRADGGRVTLEAPGGSQVVAEIGHVGDRTDDLVIDIAHGGRTRATLRLTSGTDGFDPDGQAALGRLAEGLAGCVRWPADQG